MISLQKIGIPAMMSDMSARTATIPAIDMSHATPGFDRPDCLRFSDRKRERIFIAQAP
jgi:hypothetical protein